MMWRVTIQKITTSNGEIVIEASDSTKALEIGKKLAKEISYSGDKVEYKNVIAYKIKPAHTPLKRKSF